MQERNQWSELTIAQVRGDSRLVSSKGIQPLRILNPNSYSPSCFAVLSNYGGGIVAGDHINLRISAEEGSSFFLGSQANTKIFKSPENTETQQVTHGEVAPKSLAVIFPDPIVPQAHSAYKQIQHWNMSSESVLFIADWLHSGRMDMGEQYAFTSFTSEVKVKVDGKVQLFDRFHFDPTVHEATSPANFGNYHTILSAYLMGNATDVRFQHLRDCLLSIKNSFFSTEQDYHSLQKNFIKSKEDHLIVVSQVKENLWLLRAMGKSRKSLQGVCDAIMEELANDSLLGFNPYKRKY